MTWHTTWTSVKRLLFVRLDNLGDVLLMTPAFRAVRRALPDAYLALLASPVGAQVGRLNPDLDEVIVYQAPWVDPWQQLPHDPERERAMIEELRTRRFDAAIIFTSERQSPLPAAYLCYLAGIPLRLGATSDGAGSLLTTRHRPPTQRIHEVERALDLVGSVGFATAERSLVLQVPPAAHRTVAARLAQVGAASSPLVIVHPGCSMPARTYPASHYVDVIELLLQRYPGWIVITGSDAEQSLVESVYAQLSPGSKARALPWAGLLTFPELCALIARAQLVITNNTGPAHIAAAVGTPVIVIFALTNPPEQWHPWGVPYQLLFQDVPCRLCYARICPVDHACIRRVAPEQVVESALHMLAVSVEGTGNGA
ncbi:MAG: glycosyltransferase family 9 protein [Thermorudis peleae]|nr:glycosyltransferase family 9 protein [Thermorudis peleae]